MASKQCMDCSESNIHPLDRHFQCLRCLGPSHDPFNCTYCEDFPQQVRDIRLTLSTESLADGRWPENWFNQLRRVENKCSHKLKGAQPQQNEGTPSQEGDKTNTASADNQQNENTERQNQSPMDINTNQGTDQGQTTILTPSNPLPITPQGLDLTSLASWQTGINTMMVQMSKSIQGVMDRFEAFTNQQQPQPTPRETTPVESTPKKHKHRKTSKSKSKTKSKSKKDSVQPPTKRRKKAAETAPNPNAGVDPTPGTGDLDYSTQSDTGTSLSLPSELGQEYRDMPPPPSFPIPRRSESPSPSRVDVESDSDSDLEIDINRKDKRKLYLHSLRTLVPSLKHDTQREAKESGHFSLLQKPTTVVPKMPFLDEVFTQVANTSSPSDPFNKSKVKNFRKIKKYYPTTEPAESGLLSLRKVPPEILNQVPNYKINKNVQKQSLNPTFVEGTKEQAAIQSFNYASAAMRIANNAEIGVEAQGSLINRCFNSLDRITKSMIVDDDPIELPTSVQNQLGSIKTSLNLMRQTLFDLKSSNNDLLQLALGQYNDSLMQHRNAWLGATQLPLALVNQLKVSDMPQPKPTDGKGQLDMFTQDQVDLIKKHTDAKKDSAIIQLCTQRARGRGRAQGRPRTSYRGGVSRGFVPQSHPQVGPQPRGRGRGRSFRSRGNSQSFARGQGKQTSV